jgi:hypothetical protein
MIILPKVTKLEDLIDPKTGEYYTDEVSVTSYVQLMNRQLTKLPAVKFGTIGTFFYCTDNELTSLEGVHKIIKKIGGAFYCWGSPIKTGGIGLILIEGLTRIRSDQPAFKIINRYLGQGKKGLLRCQDELIEAGYEEFARL